MTLPTLPRNTYGQSVKHLECSFYFQPSGCRLPESQCKYAHHRTGRRAKKPRHIPGFGAVAGGNISRARAQAQTCQRTLQSWRSGSSTDTGAGIGIDIVPGPSSQTPSPDPMLRHPVSGDQPTRSVSPPELIRTPTPTLTPATSPTRSVDEDPPARILYAKCRITASEAGFCPAPGCGRPGSRRRSSGKLSLLSRPRLDDDFDEEEDWNNGVPFRLPPLYEGIVR